MSTLEEAVNSLASALDALEANLAHRLGEISAHHEFSDAARRHARTARQSAGAASDALASAIAELKTVLQETDGKGRK
jgi:ubiquinone biosynthesis protein UbiJ